jgi:hypothetical protein
MTCPFHNHLWRYSHGQRITYDSSSSSSTEVLPHITDYQLVGDIFVYIKLHEFACKGEIVSQTDPNNYLFVLLIELDDDDNVKKGEQQPLWMLLPAVLFKIALHYETSMALVTFCFGSALFSMVMVRLPSSLMLTRQYSFLMPGAASSIV